MDYKKIREKILQFRSERDWKQFHNPKDLAAAISIEASELQEKFLWKDTKESCELAKTSNEIHEEFADIMNYLILFAEECDIDITKVILDKIDKNSDKYPIDKSKSKNTKYNRL